MQSAKSSIRKKFGLDYLITSESEQAERIASGEVQYRPRDKEIEKALVAVGGKILSILNEAPNNTAQLYNLVDAMDIELETLFSLIERLESLELVRYTERDKRGNHKIQLTPIGEKWLH